MVQSDQHAIYRLMEGTAQEGPICYRRNWRRMTAVSGRSHSQPPQKETPWNQVLDLLYVQLASYLEGPLTWIMALRIHVKHVNQLRNDDGSSFEYKRNNTYIHLYLIFRNRLIFTNSVQTMWDLSRTSPFTIVYILFSCPLGSWASLWNFKTIRGSLMRPK